VLADPVGVSLPRERRVYADRGAIAFPTVEELRHYELIRLDGRPALVALTGLLTAASAHFLVPQYTVERLSNHPVNGSRSVQWSPGMTSGR